MFSGLGEPGIECRKTVMVWSLRDSRLWGFGFWGFGEPRW